MHSGSSRRTPQSAPSAVRRNVICDKLRYGHGFNLDEPLVGHNLNFSSTATEIPPRTPGMHSTAAEPRRLSRRRGPGAASGQRDSAQGVRKAYVRRVPRASPSSRADSSITASGGTAPVVLAQRPPCCSPSARSRPWRRTRHTSRRTPCPFQADSNRTAPAISRTVLATDRRSDGGDRYGFQMHSDRRRSQPRDSSSRMRACSSAIFTSLGLGM